MSGIPQELIQRLAQELLRQVRLEAAMDPPSAITLATEEAAADREETGPTSRRPLNRRSRRTCQGSSTRFCSALLSLQRALQLAQLPARPHRHHRRIDDFLLEYLQEGAELAGEYSHRIADKRASQAAYRAEHDRRADLRASTHAVELVRGQLAGFQRTTASRSAALQRQLEEVEENRWRNQRGAPGDAGDRTSLRKRCPVCGLEGTTDRGRECPNRSAHGAIMATKVEDANQR